MSQQYLFGLLVLISCFILEATSRPSNNEPNASFKVEVPVEELLAEMEERERSLTYDQVRFGNEPDENTKEILEKIKEINEGLKKPQRPKFNNNIPHTGGGYVIDRETLEKIQQIIASGKLHGTSQTNKKPQDINTINDEDFSRYSRALRYDLQPDYISNAISGPQSMPPTMPVPYMTTMPVLVMPSYGIYGGYPINNDINSMQPEVYQTRQRPPALPFQIQWPLAPYFPILVKDPLLHYLSGGRWDNLFEYGQNADVCNRKQKSAEENNIEEVLKENEKENVNNMPLEPVKVNSREGRAIKKRTVSKSVPLQDLNNLKKTKNIFSLKPTTTPKPKKHYIKETQNTKTTDLDDGDVRFTSDFTWFGNRKPVAPSPGFFINRLKVRRGGVAIAGPGGVATAGRGGTAVVGPGGLAYTQPGGIAVAGPAARVVALSQESDLASIVSRLQQQSATDGSIPRLLQAIPEGKVVATGPVIYYHPYKPL